MTNIKAQPSETLGAWKRATRSGPSPSESADLWDWTSATGRRKSSGCSDKVVIAVSETLRARHGGDQYDTSRQRLRTPRSARLGSNIPPDDRSRSRRGPAPRMRNFCRFTWIALCSIAVLHSLSEAPLRLHRRDSPTHKQTHRRKK